MISAFFSILFPGFMGLLPPSIYVQDFGASYSIQHQVVMDNKSYPVTAQIQKSPFLKIKEDFGLAQKSILKSVAQQLQIQADQMARQRGLQIQIKVTLKNRQIGWELSAEENMDRQILQGFSTEIASLVPPIEVQAFREAGFAKYEGDLISGRGNFGPYYEKVIRDNTAALEPLARSIHDTARFSRLSPRETFSLLLAYVQEIPYQIPPMTSNRKMIGGFLPPTVCVVENTGDCDTKSTLLVLLARYTNKNNAILLTVPRDNGSHMIAALRTEPTPEDVVVEHNGFKYVCCEPAGPAKLPLGQLDPGTEKQISTALIISQE